MITKTEAVVLKSMNFRDSSKIVTFYTRHYGKLKGIAKGARQMKSKFGAALEPITNVSLVLYKKEHRDLQLISQCDTVKTYNRIHSELERMAIALSVLELIHQLAHDEERNDLLYALLVDTLDEIERAKKNFLNFLFAFEIRGAVLLGFAPNLDGCSVCGRGLDHIATEGSAVFQLSKGAVICGHCGASAGRAESVALSAGGAVRSDGSRRTSIEGNVRVSVGALKALHRLMTARMDAVQALDLNLAEGNEIDGTLRLYLRQHFEELKPLKSLDMLNASRSHVSGSAYERVRHHLKGSKVK
jgi:DNA repair protein RecO (recombination protein O)